MREGEPVNRLFTPVSDVITARKVFNRVGFAQYEVMVEFRQYPRTPGGRSSKAVRLAMFSLLLSC